MFFNGTQTQNFLELEFNIVAKILSSSQLNIHSELEVINAATKWLRYNAKVRSKFTKQLLLTVRLPLLSDDAINYILTKTSLFTENTECVNVLQEVLIQKEKFIQSKSSKYRTIRYCNQKKFNIIL